MKGLFKQVSPIEDFKNASQGYFVQNDLLLRKWVPHADNVLGEPVLQIVIPSKVQTDSVEEVA